MYRKLGLQVGVFPKSTQIDEYLRKSTSINKVNDLDHKYVAHENEKK